MGIRAFVDTSLLMEFKPIREIDWKQLLETAEKIVVTIAPIVTKELGNHKHGRDPRKRDRARSATKEIALLHRGQEIEGRPGVTVDFSGNPSRELLGTHDLEWDAGDDQLLGSMLVERGKTRDTIVLISDDLNLRQRSHQLGFKALAPLEKYERTPESDPRDATIRRQAEMIKKYEDTRPQLALAFDKSGVQELESTALKALDSAKVASEYLSELFHARASVNEDEILGTIEQHRARSQLMADWLEKWQDTTNQQSREEATLARTLRAELWLVNTGLVEALDVRVFIRLPEHVESANPEIRFPPFPSYPQWNNIKGSLWHQIADLMPKFARRPSVDWPPHFARQLAFVGPSRHDEQVIFQLPGPLPYDSSGPLGPFGLTFKKEHIPEKAVELSYEIRAAGTPAQAGRLLIRFKADSAS